jgi:glucosamine-phosphate N-acetyltransferase
MVEIKFIMLDKLLNSNPTLIETIKNEYLSLLSELSTTLSVETDVFLDNITKINQMGFIVVGVINDISNNYFKFVASGTIIIEPKIIRGCKNVGHIEDIVVSKDMRGMGVSQHLLEILKEIAIENNCYKVILDCDEEVKKVYLKSGFNVKGIQMAEYFP